MVSVAGRVAEAPHEGLLSGLLGPQLRFVELARVPLDLENDLRYLDGVRRRARRTVFVVARGRPRYVAVVVGAVEVDAVPAGGEVDGGEDAHRTHVVGEGGGAFRVAGVFPNQAGVVDALLLGRAGGVADAGVAVTHSEPLLEGDNVGRVLSRGEVIDGDAAAARRLAEDGANLLHPLIRSVSCAEVHDGGPVVGKVIRIGACGAWLIARHGRLPGPWWCSGCSGPRAGEGVAILGLPGGPS
ncbi:hypothetical protein VTG60DRAFT_2038 [Thermothelomyces hinnuleus]